MVKIIKVGLTAQGRRLDVFMTDIVNPRNRTFAKDLVENKQILVNGKEAKPSHKLKSGEQIIIKRSSAPKPPKIALPITYEDENCVVIDKPAGILTHNKGAFNPEATVATFIASKINGMQGERAGIVHRLDRSTSGVIICAKNSTALAFLQKQFAKRQVKKQYLAIIEGRFKEPSAIIDMPIERNPNNPRTFRVGVGGKPAQTKYTTLKTFTKANKEYSLIRFEPLTGRTHQLRVHSAKLGQPIVGDEFYGDAKASRLMLHASSLELTLPSGERRKFNSPTPKQFKLFVNDDNV